MKCGYERAMNLDPSIFLFESISICNNEQWLISSPGDRSYFILNT